MVVELFSQMQGLIPMTDNNDYSVKVVGMCEKCGTTAEMEKTEVPYPKKSFNIEIWMYSCESCEFERHGIRMAE